MEWITCIKECINYIEDNLKDIEGPDEVANHLAISCLYLQKGFQVLSGYSIGEYIRNRRLYEAGVELTTSNKSITQIAYDYGYETPESFTKAFTRFHGYSPSETRKTPTVLKTFVPLTIKVMTQGGFKMDYKIVKMFPMKFIGFERVFKNDCDSSEIPAFWDELCEKYAYNVYAGNEPANAYEKALMDNCIGEYAVCIDDLGDDSFRYLVAGKYTGGEVPEGMVLYELPFQEYAIFDCIGPAAETIQKTSKYIFSEWLVGNKEYELSGNCNIEWYDCLNGEKSDPDYHSAIWVPVKRISKED